MSRNVAKFQKYALFGIFFDSDFTQTSGQKNGEWSLWARLASREREKEEAARKKADEANTEKWEKKLQDLRGKIKAKKGFIEEQNNIQKTALAKGETMKSADALRHNLRAAELARMTVERESKDLNDPQEQLARHMGKKPKKP